MSIVVSMPNPERLAWWADHLAALLPEHEVRTRLDPGPPQDARFAVVWKPEPGWLARFPNLQAVVSIGAGVDHVLADPEFPAHLPVIKTVGDDLTQRMREYVALHVLALHRRQPEIEAATRERRWHQIVVPPATRVRVGVMGLGTLGRAAATTLAGLGFQISGWSRSGGEIAGAEVHAGADALHEFAAAADILVCLLPLTPETRGILDADLLSALPEGASLLNAARGGHLVEADLLAALDGPLAHATLDVAATEPLPVDHPFWTHPHVTVTCHTASLVDPETGGRIIAANIRAFERDGRVEDMADAGRGY